MTERQNMTATEATAEGRGFEDLFIVPTGSFSLIVLPGGKVRVCFGGVCHELSARKALGLSKALRAFGSMALADSTTPKRKRGDA